MNLYATIINTLAKKYDAQTYLEIGVHAGTTFFDVNIKHKTAVDPQFQFDINNYAENENIFLFNGTSDDFFFNFSDICVNSYRQNLKFDIIFIDGLHTYRQSLRDFDQSLKCSHDNTIFILDDTVPRDPWAAIPDVEKSYMYRKSAGIAGIPWHGDVFKTVFTIHDYYPDFSYLTICDIGNPFTIIWKTPTRAVRDRIFCGFAEIDSLNYFDMLDHAPWLNLVAKEDFEKWIGKHFELPYPDDVQEAARKIITKIKLA